MKPDRKQVHRIELIVQLDNEDVGEWVDEIYAFNNKLLFQESPSIIWATETNP